MLVLGPSLHIAAAAGRTVGLSTGNRPLSSNSADTTTWVLRARRGERAAFEHLARSFMRPAYVVALAIVRRPSDAEDVAQDSLLLAFQRLDGCREPDRFTAWLMTIVRNQARNWLDKRRLRDVLPVDHDDSRLTGEDVPSAPHDDRSRLLVALEVLSPVEREVLLLHDLQGNTHEEIGEIIGISTVMSRQHLFISRRKLRQVLGSKLGDSENEGCNDE